MLGIACQHCAPLLSHWQLHVRAVLVDLLELRCYSNSFATASNPARHKDHIIWNRGLESQSIAIAIDQILDLLVAHLPHQPVLWAGL